jgi:hypothetical protein
MLEDPWAKLTKKTHGYINNANRLHHNALIQTSEELN